MNIRLAVVNADRFLMMMHFIPRQKTSKCYTCAEATLSRDRVHGVPKFITSYHDPKLLAYFSVTLCMGFGMSMNYGSFVRP